MDQNARWEQIARLNEAAPPPAPRATPVLGRSALAVAVVAIVLFLFTASDGFPMRAFAGIARQIVMIAGPALGGLLAVASFVRRERRAPAVAALCVLVAAPLLVYLLTVVVFWGYGQGLG